ncbi:peptidoglycan-binding protein LysM [Microcosmobacter mediterraneus]
MIKQKFNYYAIPLAICTLLVLALYPDSKVDMTKYSTDGLELNFTVSKDLASADIETKKDDFNEYAPVLGNSFTGFKEALAFKESRGNYFTVNTLGYLGKYQFGAETLKMIGVYNPQVFLQSPKLQEKAFLANTSRNKWILRKDIKRFVGKQIAGVKITESGILAAAHLAGPGSVKKFLRSYGKTNFSDAYGTTIRYYMKKFSGYDTSSIEANKKAKARV